MHCPWQLKQQQQWQWQEQQQLPLLQLVMVVLLVVWVWNTSGGHARYSSSWRMEGVVVMVLGNTGGSCGRRLLPKRGVAGWQVRGQGGGICVQVGARVRGFQIV